MSDLPPSLPKEDLIPLGAADDDDHKSQQPKHRTTIVAAKHPFNRTNECISTSFLTANPVSFLIHLDYTFVLDSAAKGSVGTKELSESDRRELRATLTRGIVERLSQPMLIYAAASRPQDVSMPFTWDGDADAPIVLYTRCSRDESASAFVVRRAISAFDLSVNSPTRQRLHAAVKKINIHYTLSRPCIYFRIHTVSGGATAR